MVLTKGKLKETSHAKGKEILTQGKQLTKGHKHSPKAIWFEYDLLGETYTLKGFVRQIWALVHFDKWGPCNRHNNLIMSHRHNSGDEVLEQWLPKP